MGIEGVIGSVADRPADTLVHLSVSGTVDLAGRRQIDICLDTWQARLRYLHRDLDKLVDEPSPDDLDTIDRSGFVRAAVDRLKSKADDPADTERDVARTALRLLYIEHVEAGN